MQSSDRVTKADPTWTCERVYKCWMRTAVWLFALLAVGTASAMAQGPTVTVRIAIWDDVRAANGTRAEPRGALVSPEGFLALIPTVGEDAVFGPEVVESRGTGLVLVRLRTGTRYTLRVWPRGSRVSPVDIPLLTPLTLCPKGCDRDTVHVELYPTRAEAWGTSVVNPGSANTLVIRWRPTPLKP